MKKLLIIFTFTVYSLSISLAQQNIEPEADTTILLQEAARAHMAASSLEQEILEDGGNVKDLIVKGIITKFSASVVHDLEYHSNATYDGDSGQGAWLSRTAVQLGTYTELSDNLYLGSIAKATTRFYESVGGQDSWGLYGNAYLNYKTDIDWLPQFYAGPELFRYQSWNTGDATTSTIAATAGFRDQFKLFDKGTQLFYIYKYSARFSDPGRQDREAQSFTIGITQPLFIKGLTFQPYYSIAARDYMHSNRFDLTHSAGASLKYRINNNISLRIDPRWTENDSNLEFADYEDYAIGLNTTLSIRF